MNEAGVAMDFKSGAKVVHKTHGVGVISGQAIRVEPEDWSGGLYQPESSTTYSQSTFTFKAIPYCFWANREPGEMRVWIRES